MKLSDSGGKEFAQAPTGNHVARCVKVIDLGTQRKEWEGKVSVQRKVMIGWELPNELIPDGDAAGKPFVVSGIYTASISEKATLRGMLTAWRDRDFSPDELKEFEIRKILGAPCMLSVVKSAKGKSVVGGVASMPKGMVCPKQVNPSLYFSLDPDEFKQEEFAALGKWHQETIAQSPEYLEVTSKGRGSPERELAEMDDDIAF